MTARLPRTLSFRFAALLLPALAWLVYPVAVPAQTYTWTGALTAGPTAWNVDANWGGTPNPFPNAVGDIANLTADFTAAPTINLTIGITVGSLALDDTGSGTDVAITLGAGGGSLIFDNTGSTNAVLTSNGATNIISAAFQINDNLDVTTTSSLNLTNNITESGSKNLNKLGAATLTLSGTNSYTGTTTATAGVLLTTKAAALPGYNVAGKAIFNGGTLGVQFGTGGWLTTELDTLLANATKTSGALGVDNNSTTAFTLSTLFTTTNLGSLGLSKVGSVNTVTLTNNANSYTGDTSIVVGTLATILTGDIGVSTNSVFGNSATAIVMGTSASNAGNLAATLQFQAGSDAANYSMSRGIDASQGTSTGSSIINFNSDGAGVANTNTLTLAGDITLSATARQTRFIPQRSGMTINITGNILQAAAGTAQLSMGGFPANPSAVDGRGSGTVRFSNLSRNYTGSNLLITGTALIDGVVGAVGTASPIGQAIIDIAQGSGGNIAGAANFSGGNVFNDTSADVNRAVFLDTAGSSFARTLAPGVGSTSTPLVSNYGSTVGAINGYQFGGKNTSGTVTFSGNIAPGDISVGSSATNPITVAANIALIAENGGTSTFSGVVSDTSIAATNTRLTINQIRNHPNIDGTNNAGTTVVSDGNADTLANNGATNYTADRLVGTAKTGTVLLSGVNTYVGTTEVLGGTLQLGNSKALGFGGLQSTATGTTAIASGAVLDLNGTTLVSEPIILNGTGVSSSGALVNNSTAASIANGIAGIQIAALTGSGSGYSAAPTVTITGTGSGATATASLGLTTASITSITAGSTGWVTGDTVNITGGNGTGALGVVTASGGAVTAITITKPGSGYTAAPTGYSKNTSIAGAGTTTLTGNATNFTVSGVTLTAAGTGYTGTPTVAFTGTATVAATATTTLSSVTLASTSSVGGTGDIAINAVVSESGGAMGLTKVGAGTLTLAGANTYTGGTTITTGKLQLGSGGTTGSLSTTGAIVDNANLTINRSNAVVQGTDFSGTAITGSGSFTQAGTGTTTLNAANTYAGPTTISAGTLSAGASDNLGANTSNLVFDGGTFQVTGTTLSNFSTIGHTVVFNTNKDVGLDINNAANVFTTDQVLNQGTGALTKLGAGTSVLNQANTYSGGTNINAGILNLGVGQSGTGGPLGGSGAVSTVGTIKFGSGGVAGTLQYSASNTVDYTSRFSSATGQAFNIDTNGQTVIFASQLQGTGNTLTKLGTGTLNTTSNSNNYTGGTTISAGTLQIGNNGTTGGLPTASAILNNGTLAFNRTDGVAQGTNFSNAAISGTGSIIQNGTSFWYASILQLTSANSYSGTTTISNGTINVGANSILSGTNGPLGNATSAIVLGDANTLAVSGAPNAVLRVTGANNTGQNFTISRNVTSTATANTSGRNDIGFEGGASTVGTLTVSGNWALATGASRGSGLWAQQAGQTMNFTGVISGGNTSSSFNINDYGQGTGAVRLGNGNLTNNTYVSPTTVIGGTLLIAGDNALGTHATLQLSAGSNNNGLVTALTDGAYTVAKAVSLVDGGSTVNWRLGGNTANASTFSGAISTSSSTSNKTLTLAQVSGGSVTFSGVIGGNAGTGATSLDKTGAGTTLLAKDNTYDGTTMVSDGTLVVAGNQTASGPVTGQFVVNNNGTLQFGDGTSTNGSATAAGTIFVNNTGTVTINKANSGTVTNQIASNPSAVTTLSGLNATGTINTFTGTNYSNGGSFATISTNAGAVLAFSGASPGAIDLKGTNLVVGGAGDTLFTGAGTGIYSSTTASNVKKVGTGTLIYQGNQGYTGTTAINAGAVRADVAQTSGGTYFVGDGTNVGTQADPASLLLGGGSAGLSGGVSFNRGITINPGNGTSRTVGGTNTSNTNTFTSNIALDGSFGENRSVNLTAAGGGTVAFTGGISGTGQNVTKSGDGTVIFGADTTYSGSTVVNAGTLLVNATTNGTSGVTVNNSGSLLGGIGTIGSAVTINGGAGITGDAFGAVGALTLSNNLTLIGTSGSSLASYLVDLSDTAADLLSITGDLNLGAFNNLSVNQIATPTSERYVIATYTGILNGMFDNFSGPAGYSLDYSIPNEIGLLTPVPVPEPSTWVGAGLITALVGWSQRKRLRVLLPTAAA